MNKVSWQSERQDWAEESATPGRWAALHYLDTAAPALYICDSASLRPVWINEGGHNLLQSSGPLTLINGRLTATSKADQTTLDRAIAAQLNAVVLSSPRSENSYIARLKNYAVDDDISRIALKLYSVDEPYKCFLPDLRGVFEFTAAEQRIIHHTIGGLRADLIAVQMGVTIETIRTHIRRIYAKTGVSSREELIHLINKYRVPA